MLRGSTGEGQDTAGRRTGRTRKVSQRVATVSVADKEQVATARLAALEGDGRIQETFGQDSDDEFQVQASDQEPELGESKRKRKGKSKHASRKTRSRAGESRGQKTFAVLLAEADLSTDPEGPPSYITAAVGPALNCAPRKWCSVCGFAAPYSCVRCQTHYCSRKCYAVHSDTRCLKFTS